MKFQNNQKVVISETGFSAVIKLYDSIRDKYLISPSQNCVNPKCTGNCSQYISEKRLESRGEYEENN